VKFSRRHFLKAAGAGGPGAVALTTVGASVAGIVGAQEPAAAQTASSPLAIPLPMTQETGTFTINGRPHRVDYESRTTLWEVVALKLRLTGTNRSCNRASCGACSVLIDGVPFYSCHTLATEAAGKKILTVEGLGDEKNLHPLQRIGYLYMAADCGFCTPGWEVTAKGLLDKNPNPTGAEVKAALAGHICRCAAYSAIVRTVVDAAAVLRGEAKEIVPRTESVIQVKLPMVRDFSTGGGHGPGDELVEGDDKIVTKKWQSYPPVNLNVVGKPMPPMPEVAMPRYTGKAEYASRIVLPDMLHARVLTSPHPRARLKNLDTSKAEQMPGVKYVLTYRNSPSTYPLPQDFNFQGEYVAIVAAETEDRAEDAVEAIQVEYEVLPSASTLVQTMSSGAPDLRRGRGNLIRLSEKDPHYDPNATWVAKHGDIEQGFRDAEIVREFTYSFGGATAVPIQTVGGVAQWSSDKLTFWGMGQGIYPQRAEVARALGIDVSNVRYINKWNGCTFGAVMQASRLNPFIAYIAKMTGRPLKLMLPKDQELAQISIKPENRTTFKVGATKDGRIVALVHEIHLNGGDSDGPGHSQLEISKNQCELYTSRIPHWKSVWYTWKTNALRTQPVRSYTQQEVKWAWEHVMDEMAEAVAMDPLQFRLLHVSRPGGKLTTDWHSDFRSRYELQDGALTYDSFASVEVLEEGAKAIGWERRNRVPGGAPGRFKRGIGVGASQHHAGHMGYHEGEPHFEKLMQGQANSESGPAFGIFSAELELTADGNVTMKNPLPDSGTNHDTALAHVVAEILGFTSRDRIRVAWGDSDAAPLSQNWLAGKTITLQGAAIFSAAEKLRKDLLRRAAVVLGVAADTLQVRDGVISSSGDPKKRMTFAGLVKANEGPIRMTGRGAHKDQGRGLAKGVGACFLEVEVDTYTGNWRIVKSAYSHDVGLVVNPLVAEADMHGSLVQSTQMTTDAVPWDREFPGTRHYGVGYLSYRLPTIMDVPEEQTNIFIDSLEPRWFYGIKSFSETSIGSVPGAIANAIYNACGVRIREHPITREKIMAGLKAMKAKREV